MPKKRSVSVGHLAMQAEALIARQCEAVHRFVARMPVDLICTLIIPSVDLHNS